MRTYNQQIEDAYASSRSEGDSMRNPEVERSSGQDRRNRSGQYEYTYEPFQEEIEHTAGRDAMQGTDEHHVGIHRGKGPRNYRRSDERILEDISEWLAQDAEIDATGIGVEVTLGEVTLSGMVPDRATKRRAEDIAEAVSGVSQVLNRIRIATTFEQRGTPDTSGQISKNTTKD